MTRSRPSLTRLSLAALFATALLAIVLGATPSVTVLWGEHGHRIVAEAAALALPAEMPQFFRDARAQLTYLNPEPDRWRDRREWRLDPAMDGKHSPEHYVDFELVPAGAFGAPHRYAYLDSLRKASDSAMVAGFLAFRILELTQRLRAEFRLWREAPDAQTRSWIEARVIDDAGILGHYVADGANPHHTTVHHDRWVGPNPKGYTTERGFHVRFESEFVQAQLTLAEARAEMRAAPRVLANLRPAIIEYLRGSFALVERLYELDKLQRFGADTRSPEHERFAAQRLAAGAEQPDVLGPETVLVWVAIPGGVALDKRCLECGVRGFLSVYV
jgi:hypothetical protein